MVSLEESSDNLLPIICDICLMVTIGLIEQMCIWNNCIYNLYKYLVVPFLSDVVIMDANIKILVILKHYFKLDLKADKAALRIREMKGSETISDHTAQNCFKQLKVIVI